MPALTEQLSKLNTTVMSPDYRLSATVTRVKTIDIRVHFRSHSLRAYAVQQLAEQLAAVFAAGWADYRSFQDQARASFAPLPVVAPDATWDGRRSAYREQAMKIVAVGKSNRGFVRLRTVGGKAWTVTIKPEALSLLNEAAIQAEIDSAHEALAANYRLRELALKSRFFDMRMIRRDQVTANPASYGSTRPFRARARNPW